MLKTLICHDFAAPLARIVLVKVVRGVEKTFWNSLLKETGEKTLDKSVIMLPGT